MMLGKFITRDRNRAPCDSRGATIWRLNQRKPRRATWPSPCLQPSTLFPRTPSQRTVTVV